LYNDRKDLNPFTSILSSLEERKTPFFPLESTHRVTGWDEGINTSPISLSGKKWREQNPLQSDGWHPPGKIFFNHPPDEDKKKCGV